MYRRSLKNQYLAISTGPHKASRGRNTAEKTAEDRLMSDSYEDAWIEKTDHPSVVYDSLTEAFSVDLGDGAYCDVFGKNRRARAMEIAAQQTHIKKLESKVAGLEEREALCDCDFLADRCERLDAEVKNLENHVASGTHTCTPTCKRPMCALHPGWMTICHFCGQKPD